MRKSIQERLAQIEARRQSLKARLGKQQRTEETRRKILIGALVLHHLEHGKDAISKNLSDWLRHELPGFLTRDGDRYLFIELLDPSHASQDASSKGGDE